MKGYSTWGLVLMVLVPVASSASDAMTFGPKNCVSLTRSEEGSCVLTTDCEGSDISATEFAFDCVAQSGDVVRHSFGVGGFEASEEFDTEVKCGSCSHPEAGKPQKKKVEKVEAVITPAPVAVQAAPVEAPKPKHEDKIPGVVAFRSKGQAAANAKAKMWPFSRSRKNEVSSVPAVGVSRRRRRKNEVKYGPNGCVSTWRSSEGHCMMATDCEGTNISNYEFGLVCVDKVGSPVKHLFGKDSFDSKESFDTLIKCKECLGLEDVPDQVVLAGEVATMAKELNNLKDVMKNVSINVQMLNAKIFPAKPSAPAPSPEAAAPAPAAAAKPQEKALLHQDVSHRRHHGNLRRAHRHHHHHRRHDDDDDDDDEEEDRDDRDDNRRDDDDRQDVREALARAAVAPPVAVMDVPTVAPKSVPLNDVSKTSADDDGDEGSDED
jgi:hypothetical protein